MTIIAHPTHPVVDLSLARRLERTEAVANAAFIEARAQLEPAAGATWMEVAGAYAMFDGPASPLTQTFGLGIFDEVGHAELEQLESFFTERDAPVQHEVSPLIPQGVLKLLNGRGYEPAEFSSVLVRPTAADLGPTGSSIFVQRIDSSQIELWSEVAAQGWSSESAELADVIRGFGRIIGNARGSHCFLAHEHGRPIAAASMVLNTEIALLAGASTIPDRRKQGAQAALLEARLRFAAERGAELAMMVALPGSGSHRNAERHGFRVTYTRTKWMLRSRTA